LESFGHYLTSLEIGEVKSLTRTGMYNVLKQLPNLKALTIYNFYKGIPDYSDEPMDKCFPPLPSPNPHLIYLRIANRFPKDEPRMVKWLVFMLAPQLVSLQLRLVDVQLIGDCQFKTLKRLEVTNSLNSQFILKAPSLTFPLEHLSISCHNEIPTSQNIWEILNYIDRFSNSLISFCFDLRDSCLPFSEPGVVKKQICKFRKLEKLVVPCYNNDMKLFLVTCFRNQFVPRFQNLKRLQLDVLVFKPSPSNGGQARVKAKEFCESERFWHIFPKLETIEMGVSNFPYKPFIVTLKRWE